MWSNNREAVIDELIKGRELAGQLGAWMQEKPPGIRGLVEGVMSSLSRALVLADAKRAGSCGGSGEVRSTRRGGYRRSRSHPYSCTEITATTIDDGHLWRKYGQKAIHDAKFPRSYFRCSHKYDQNCKATRQVQRSEEDASLFVITYFGEHTCADRAQAKSSLVDGREDHRVIDFASNATGCDDHQQPQRQGFSFSKQGCDEGVVSNNLTLGSSASTGYLEFLDLGTLESDGTSGLTQTSTSNLGWEFIVDDTCEFNDLFSLI